MALIKATIVRDNIADDLTAVFKRLLLDVFFTHDSHNFERGMHLKLHDGRAVWIAARLGVAIADEAALHAMYSCKGSSGVKICQCCIILIITPSN